MHFLRGLLICFFLFLSFFGQSQDSLPKNTEISKRSWYVRMMPISMGTSAVYSTTGVSIPQESLLKNRISQNIEMGYSSSIVDIGLCYGRINIRQDSTSFLEARITMATAQIKNFSNEFSIGFGHSFNPSYPIMLEAASTMLWQVYKNFGGGVIVGYYDFAGNQGDFSKNFYGLFLRYGLARTETGSLLRRRNIIHRHR
jgi:hypothetical protein